MREAKHTKMCSIKSLVIREIHRVPSEICLSLITKIKNMENNMCWRGCGENGTLADCCGIAKWWNCHKNQNGGFSKN